MGVSLRACAYVCVCVSRQPHVVYACPLSLKGVRDLSSHVEDECDEVE